MTHTCPVVFELDVGPDDGRQFVETAVGVNDPEVVESVQVVRVESLTQQVENVLKRLVYRDVRNSPAATCAFPIFRVGWIASWWSPSR